MIPGYDQSGEDSEARSLEVELRRNRRRSLRLLYGAIAVAVLWPVYSEFRARHSALPWRLAVNPADSPSRRPRPANPHAQRKVVHPYSVIPGGTYSGAALSRALATDRIAAAHYSGFNTSGVRPVSADPGMRLYTSYRIADKIYWTAQPVAMKTNEILLTDGVHLARARCGNRLSASPQTPVGPKVDLDSVEAEEAKAQWRATDPENPGVPADTAYPMSKLVGEIFPDVFAEGDGGLPADTDPDAAEPVNGTAGPEDTETPSGRANWKWPPTLGGPMGAGGSFLGMIPMNRPGQLAPAPILSGLESPYGFSGQWLTELTSGPAIPPGGSASGVSGGPPDSTLGTSAPPLSEGEFLILSSAATSTYWDPLDIRISLDTTVGSGNGTGAGLSGGPGGSGGGSGGPPKPTIDAAADFSDGPYAEPVPEPGAFALAALGLALLAIRRAARPGAL